MSALKTVWILGAGFSRALGGPLIHHLLEWQERETIAQFFPRQDQGDAMYKARAFFRWGRGLQQWEHAEHFLDLLETAAAERPGTPPSARSNAHGLLTSILKNKVRAPGGGAPLSFDTIEELAVASRAAVAADCSLFLRSASGERWTPYLAWAKQLTANDTVVSFNYDTVPEILGESVSRLTVINPDVSASVCEDQIAEVRKANRAPVLKLHGSVNWHVEGGGFRTAHEAANETLLGRRDVILGLPGPGKQHLRARMLAPLWDHAMSAIKDARTVIFLGYRFPPTDAQARIELLGAIKDGAKISLTSVKAVLGPNDRHPDIIRLAKLLGYVVHQNHTDMVPLFAEDFIALPP